MFATAHGFFTLLVLPILTLLAPVDGFCASKRSAPLPVFPGAQGFGTETSAGRGGKILKVSNLKASGKGSLKDAIETKGPRIIVFEVGGIIELKRNLKIKDPFITIAGQTAPSPGITLKGAGLVISTHDVLVQHLRIRVGDSREGPKPEDRESLKIVGKGEKVYNIVCDHLSLSWGIDEVVSTVYGPRNLTISNSIISEGLQHSLHPKGAHSKALLVREGTKNLALIGNLFAHNHDRNPRIAGNSSVVAVNNLLYNGGRNFWFDIDSGTHGKKGPHQLSVIANVFIEGPNTPHYAWPVRIQKDVQSGTKVYLSGNLAAGAILKNDTPFDPRVSKPPLWDRSISPVPASEVEPMILSRAGARPMDRDVVDRRIFKELRARGGSFVDSVEKAGGWPKAVKTTSIFKTPTYPNRDDDGDGYTNIEEVLHWMAEEVEGKNTSSRQVTRTKMSEKFRKGPFREGVPEKMNGEGRVQGKRLHRARANERAQSYFAPSPQLPASEAHCATKSCVPGSGPKIASERISISSSAKIVLNLGSSFRVSHLFRTGMLCPPGAKSLRK